MSITLDRLVLDWDHLTNEPIRFPVSAVKNGLAVNLSTFTVGMAFKTDTSDPSSGDYITGTWDVDTQIASAPVYKAQAVPPSGLVVGTDYFVTLKLVGTDTVVRRCGVLRVY